MGVQIPIHKEAIMRAKRKGANPRHDQTCLAVDILKATQQGQNWYKQECTLAPPGKYD